MFTHICDCTSIAMGRPRKGSTLPKYLHFEPINATYYLRHPRMASRANLGRDREQVITTAQAIVRRFRYEAELEASRLVINVDAPAMQDALPRFARNYVESRRLKASSARLIEQRTARIVGVLGTVQVPMVDTQLLHDALRSYSSYEQAKMKTLLRLTLHQYKAIYRHAPEWLQWMMVLALHLALRRGDLVRLTWSDVSRGRLIARIGKTETAARGLEALSVDFPLHADVQRVLARSRESALALGRPPFVIHRKPYRITARAAAALEHTCQVLPQYATKAFERARAEAIRADPALFPTHRKIELPGLLEIRSLSAHLYAKAGYETDSVKDLMAHTDPDMTRHYQKGHERKVVRVEMTLPFSVLDAERQ